MFEQAFSTIVSRSLKQATVNALSQVKEPIFNKNVENHL